jgi:hypothetical protein
VNQVWTLIVSISIHCQHDQIFQSINLQLVLSCFIQLSVIDWILCPKLKLENLDSSWSAALGVSGNYPVGKERPRLVWQLGKGQGVSPLVIHPGLIPNIFLHFSLRLETISLISPKFSTLFVR